MADDLIKNIVNITEKYIDSPRVFHEALAYHLISVLLGRFHYLPNVKVSRPNTWFVLSCIPGRGRRSTIINLSNVAHFEALKEYYKQVEGLDEKEAFKRAWKSTIETGTVPGICDSIIEGSKLGIKEYNFSSGEFGGILKNITGGRHYSSGIDTLLSRLYYGEYFKEDLSQRGGKPSRFIPSGLYTTMFSAMQEPRHYLSPTASRQGLLRRMRIVYLKSTDFKMDRWKSPFQNDFIKCTKEVRDFVKHEIVPVMMEKYNTIKNSSQKSQYNGYIPIHIETEVKDKIEAMARKTDEDIINDPSDFNIYSQTRWEHLAKYSVLSALSEGKTCANMLHYKKALDFDRIIDKHAMEMMDDLGTSFEQEKEVKCVNRLEKKIRTAGPDGIKHYILMNAFPYMTVSEKKTYLDALQNQGRIVQKIGEKVSITYVHSIFVTDELVG